MIKEIIIFAVLVIALTFAFPAEEVLSVGVAPVPSDPLPLEEPAVDAVVAVKTVEINDEVPSEELAADGELTPAESAWGGWGGHHRRYGHGGGWGYGGGWGGGWGGGYGGRGYGGGYGWGGGYRRGGWGYWR